MFLDGEFFRLADKLSAELETLQITHPSLFFKKDLHEHMLSLNISIQNLNKSLIRLATAMAEASEAMNRASWAAMDQSNPDDSDTQDRSAYTGAHAFLRHIRRIARAMLYMVRH